MNNYCFKNIKKGIINIYIYIPSMTLNSIHFVNLLLSKIRFDIAIPRKLEREREKVRQN